MASKSQGFERTHCLAPLFRSKETPCFLPKPMIFLKCLVKVSPELSKLSVNTFISATDPPLFLGVDTCRDPGEGQF